MPRLLEPVTVVKTPEVDITEFAGNGWGWHFSSQKHIQFSRSYRMPTLLTNNERQRSGEE
jgi:hypothetical protein